MRKDVNTETVIAWELKGLRVFCSEAAIVSNEAAIKFLPGPRSLLRLSQSELHFEKNPLAPRVQKHRLITCMSVCKLYLPAQNNPSPVKSRLHIQDLKPGTVISTVQVAF